MDENTHPGLVERPWVPAGAEARAQRIATQTASADAAVIGERLATLIDENRRIHEHDCLNLNPATNVMNPRAEAALAAGLGTRPSLGYPGEKYEMGLEAIEQIEVIAAELAAEVFRARYAEVRVPSGAIANLYAFMAGAKPGDTIIAPPASIGGHVTHHEAGVAGLYGLDIHPAPVDADRYSVDVDALATMARECRPKMITIGASLNLFHHPVAEIRAIADEVGAIVLFDAAHLCGPIAGGAWPDPLADGAHLMTMSTYKSLGGPPSGLLVTNDAAIAERVDAIAYPGLTANFDAGKTAALAVALLDWVTDGPAYAAEMVATATALASELRALDVPVHAGDRGATRSHAFAIDARDMGGGHTVALRLRRANLLTSAIGLPVDAADMPAGGLRIGLNEAVRWGLTTAHMAELAALIARGLSDDPADVADDVTAFRRRFTDLHFVDGGPMSERPLI
jgi:glycine hydroxymethyltransferase